MFVSLASRTRSDTKINPVAYVSGSDVEMVPVDLATQAEAPRVERTTATAKIHGGGAAKATGALRNVALNVWSSSAEHVLQMRRRKAPASKCT